jgi:hypothetical protein
MRSFLGALRPVRDGVGRASVTGVRLSHRTAALSLMLLAASTVSVLATGNTPPSNYSIHLDKTVVNEGDSVTLTGSFTDPDAADLHSVVINWNHNPNQKVKLQLPAGQFTFTAAHTYPDDIGEAVEGGGKKTWIHTNVADKDAPGTPNENAPGEDHWAGAGGTMIVRNVAPSFAQPISVQKASGKSGAVVIEGDIEDPGADTFEVFAKWVEGSPLQNNPGQPCTVTRRHFKCEHTYKPAQVKGYAVQLTVKDDDGGVGKTIVHVPMP